MKKFIFLLITISIIMLINNCKKDDTDKSNTSGWMQLGNSFESQIYDVISDREGNIYMSGGEIWNILVWNGTKWNKVGDISNSPFTNGLYWPITVDKDGNVYAVGRIKVPQANSEYHVAKWIKSLNKWFNLTNNQPLFDNGIHSLVTDTLGNLYASGNVISMSSIEQGNYIYKWDGNTWTMLGGSKLPPSEFVKMHIDKSGNLLASFYNDNISPCVSKWNGSGWDELGGKNNSNFGTGQIYCINSDSKGNVYAGGYYILGDSAFNIYKWTKSTNNWTAFYTYGSSLSVNSIAFDSGDTLYVAGKFVNSSNKNYIGKQQGNKWADYGNLSANNTINSICFDKYGNMYAGGEFTDANNQFYVAYYKNK